MSHREQTIQDEALTQSLETRHLQMQICVVSFSRDDPACAHIYIYVHIYKSQYVYICVYICRDIYIYIYIYIYISQERESYIRMYNSTYVIPCSTDTCIYQCVYKHIYTCVYVCICMYTYIYVYIYIHVYWYIICMVIHLHTSSKYLINISIPANNP